MLLTEKDIDSEFNSTIERYAYLMGAKALLKKVVEWLNTRGVVGHNKDGAVEILLNPKDWQSLSEEAGVSIKFLRQALLARR